MPLPCGLSPAYWDCASNQTSSANLCWWYRNGDIPAVTWRPCDHGEVPKFHGSFIPFKVTGQKNSMVGGARSARSELEKNSRNWGEANILNTTNWGHHWTTWDDWSIQLGSKRIFQQYDQCTLIIPIDVWISGNPQVTAPHICFWICFLTLLCNYPASQIAIAVKLLWVVDYPRIGNTTHTHTYIYIYAYAYIKYINT